MIAALVKFEHDMFWNFLNKFLNSKYRIYDNYVLYEVYILSYLKLIDVLQTIWRNKTWVKS